jgi:hypothetical protein
MSGQTRFRVLTAEGLVSHEVFTIAPFQPPNMARGNVLLACQSGGFPVMVHESRLIPLSMPKHHGDGGQIAACHKCGRVEGISAEQIHCPYHHGVSCGLAEATASAR